MREEGLKKVFPLFLLLIFISCFLFLAEDFGWFSKVRGFFQKPFLTLERPIFLTYQSINNFSKKLTLRNESQQIVELQTQLRQLAVDQNKLSSCLEENEHLKKLLGSPLPPKWKFKMAKVIGISEEMKIDQGKDGIKEGMTVVTENIYVGKVISTGENYSLIQLPIDLNSKIPVVVKKVGSSGIQARGLLVGQPGGKLLLDKVLQEEDIRQGDLVVTSGEEGYLPDLVIGQIKEILKGTAEIHKQAIVLPLIDYSSLRFVFVVIP